MAKMGRPKAESPKQKLVSVRLTKEEHEKLSEYAQQRNLTLTQAVKRGIKTGVYQNKKDTALSMLKDKIPIFQIAKYTNLSVDEIKKLR